MPSSCAEGVQRWGCSTSPRLLGGNLRPQIWRRRSSRGGGRRRRHGGRRSCLAERVEVVVRVTGSGEVSATGGNGGGRRRPKHRWPILGRRRRIWRRWSRRQRRPSLGVRAEDILSGGGGCGPWGSGDPRRRWPERSARSSARRRHISLAAAALGAAEPWESKRKRLSSSAPTVDSG